MPMGAFSAGLLIGLLFGILVGWFGTFWLRRKMDEAMGYDDLHDKW